MKSSVSTSDVGFDHAPGLMRLASRLAGRPDAEDLVQATWLRALEHTGEVRARRPWLRRVLLNEWQMDRRGRGRREERETASAAPIDDPVDLEDVVHCFEVARVVSDLLEELDADVQTVVRERYFQGETAAEIARKHAIPAGTVRWRLKTGLDSLRDRLDARFGGRRALWAGGFGPAALGPTLSTGAASQPATASGTTAAAAKGVSAMSLKILLGTGIVAATAGGVVLVGTMDDRDPAEATPTPQVAAAATHTEVDDPIVAPKSNPLAKAKAKANWQKRLSRIRAAHASREAESAAASGGHAPHGSWASADAAKGPHSFGTCTDDDCMTKLAQEIYGMTESCQELLFDAPSGVSLTATVVGAPDIGTVVESVDLDTGGDDPGELGECMTEAMYDLELGDTEASFRKELTVQLNAELQDLDDLNLEDYDEETRAKIEEALAGAGNDSTAQVHMLRLGTEEHQEAE